MSILVLGGTQWVGRGVVAAALSRGEHVTVLARGESGEFPTDVDVVRADRADSAAYDAVRDTEWDVVVDVTRQPSHALGAVSALGPRAGSWILVSSASVYAADDSPGDDESARLHEPHDADDEGWETYGGRKVACEQHVLAAVPDRALVARSGLIAGPGDHTDRTGYWPLRFAHPADPDGAVLVPDSTVATQVVDVRDLTSWLVEAGLRRATGVVNAAGPSIPLGEHLATAREVAGHDGELVAVEQDWLVARGVTPWSGERSLPLWLPLPEYAGFMARTTEAAQALGLSCRPLAQTLQDTMEWELRTGPGRARRAGLSPSDEVALIDQARQVGVGGPSH